MKFLAYRSGRYMLTTFVCKIRGAVWCGCKTCNVKLLKKAQVNLKRKSHLTIWCCHNDNVSCGVTAYVGLNCTRKTKAYLYYSQIIYVFMSSDNYKMCPLYFVCLTLLTMRQLHFWTTNSVLRNNAILNIFVLQKWDYKHLVID